MWAKPISAIVSIDGPPNRMRNTGPWHNAPMANWSWNVLRAGGLRLDGGGMFGIIPRTMWTDWIDTDASNRIPLQTNCILLRRDGQTVLIEAGCGDKWSVAERDFYAIEDRTVVDALREIDVQPEEIDLVVTTHLHFDHAGGLTRLDGDGAEARPVPVFPNADVVVQRRELEDAIANRSTMTRTYLPNHIQPMGPRFRPVEGAVEIMPGLRVEPLPGHTPGMHGVFIETDAGTVVFPGDLLPTIHHAHPSAATAYDQLPYETFQTKRSFMRRAAEARWTIVLDHDAGDPVVQAAFDDRGKPRLMH